MTRAASPIFVGRRTELAALQAALDAAGSGRTTAVLVGGEAGAGKSRLLAEFVGGAEAAGVRILTGGCLALGAESLPYAPFTQALGRLVAELGPAGVEDLIGPGRAELARLLPELRRQDDDAHPAGAHDRAVLFQVVLRALEGVAGSTPLVLLIEDLHWADASSRELLAFLIARLRAAVLVVATYRNDEIHRRHPLRPFLAEAARSERVTRIDLGPLTAAEVAQQLEGIAGTALPQSLVDAVVARAEGNPFFAEELLAAGGGEELPPDLAEVLAARLESLPDDAQELVGVAAVAGRQVRHELLAAVAGLSGAELASGLREAAAHQVLVASPAGTYAFRHALLAEAAYAQLLPAERAPLHRACAAALSTNPEWAANPARAAGEIAHHYAAGNDARRALGALVEAAGAAADSYAFAEAHALYEQALGLWDQVAEAEVIAGTDRAQLLERGGDAALLAGASGRAVAMVRAALAHVDTEAQPARAALLNERLSRMLWRRGEGEASLAASRAAVALMPTEPSAERARILAGQARTLLLAGRYREAGEQAHAAMDVARAAGARREEGDALNTYGTSLGRLGRAGEAVAILEEALAIAESIGNIEDIRRANNNLQVTLEDGLGDPRRAATVGLAGAAHLERLSYVDGATYLRTAAAISLVTAGCWAEAESLALAALAANADGVTAWRARMAAGTVSLRGGDVATGHAHLEAAHRLCAESTDTDYRAMLGIAFAELALVEGRLADARTVVDDTLDAVGDTDAHDYVLLLISLGLRAEAEQDRALRSKTMSARERALPLHARASAIARPANGPPWAPSVQGRVLSLLCRAEWARVTGEHDPVLWSEVATAWAEISHPYEAAYALWRAAEAHLVAGAKDEGIAILRQAFEDASRLGAAPLVADIEALARRARARLVTDGGPGAGPDDDFGLTDRESEVLALVASGHTNRQIAEALFMSEKTASVHVSRILAKLGVSTRGQAAALAHRLELVDRASAG